MLEAVMPPRVRADRRMIDILASSSKAEFPPNHEVNSAAAGPAMDIDKLFKVSSIAVYLQAVID